MSHFFKSFMICGAFLLSYSAVSAEATAHDYLFAEHKNLCEMQSDHISPNQSIDLNCSHSHRHRKKCKFKIVSAPLGIAAFRSAVPYTIETSPYPETVLLSDFRNAGSTQGDIQFNPSGLTIGEAGNYSISFLTILQNPSLTNGAVITVFLTLNGSLDPNEAKSASVAILATDGAGVAQATTILENVTPGTTVSLIAANGGGKSQPINVNAWEISLFKIADEVVKKK